MKTLVKAITGVNSPKAIANNKAISDTNRPERISDANSPDIISDPDSPEARAVEAQIEDLQKQIADGSLRSSIGKRDRQKHQEILEQITVLTRRLPVKPDVNLVRQETEYL